MAMFAFWISSVESSLHPAFNYWLDGKGSWDWKIQDEILDDIDSKYGIEHHCHHCPSRLVPKQRKFRGSGLEELP